MTDFPAGTADPSVALRNALVDAIGRRRKRVRSRVAVVGGVCVAVAAAVLAGGVFTGGGPERVLAIDEGSAWARIQILDGDAGATEMTQELQDAGINGEVQQVPAVPQLVGHWMGIGWHSRCGGGRTDSFLGRLRPKEDVVCVTPMVGGIAAGLDGNTFVIRRDAISAFLPGKRLILYVGREPAPGEKPLDAPPRSDDIVVAQPGDLQRFNPERLYKFARRQGIPGASKMNKWHLLELLQHSR
jgi:hypothetical protein